jgi:hypothetical protein
VKEKTMAAIEMSFSDRLVRLSRKHRRMENAGVRAVMGDDGLVRPVPRLALPPFPWASLVILFAIAMAFKGWMYAELGATEYESRLGVMESGDVLDQAGAWIMASDPVTRTIGGWWQALGV